ncbi:MAG: DUF6488 family protein [Desulfobacterales bacterium]
MKNFSNIMMIAKKVIPIPLLFILIVFMTSQVWSHGPKGHGDVSFTALEAAKKGIQLYDRLLESGKLADSWETELVDIRVFNRNTNNKKEVVVQFNRMKGEPRSVYIFFSDKGEYSGSNFTGE